MASPPRHNDKEHNMGAETFTTTANGKTASEAFEKARQEAMEHYGNQGYTGSIAEKSSFVKISTTESDEFDTVYDFADHLIDTDDKRISDKWGPAGCIDCGGGDFLFFGWASS